MADDRGVVPRPSPPAAAGTVWPNSLLISERPPALVYLDLNHWINLAKAATGHASGPIYAGPLDAAREAHAAGRALFPLSGTHYQELGGIEDPRQRKDVAFVMEELSGFATLLSRSTLMRMEIEAALEDRLGPSPGGGYAPVALVGHGFGHPFGRSVQLRIRDNHGNDRSAAVGAERLAEMDLYAQRRMLAGPEDHELAALRARGWNPESAQQVTENRAAEERAQVARFDGEPRWRRGRLWDSIAAREFRIELLDMLLEALGRRGAGLDAIMGDGTKPSGREPALAFARAMPSTAVSISLKVEMHRNGQRAARWTTNDVHDIEAMSLAVPYCDVVVTENHRHDALTKDGADRRYDTVLLRDLQALEVLLPTL